MKKITKKIRARIDFVSMLKLHPTHLQLEEVETQIKQAKDPELVKLVDRFIDAFLDLEEKAAEMKEELTAYLVDDSDF
jgi:hypothetical protein